MVSAPVLEVDLTGVYSIGLRLTTEGRIVDFLNPEVSRPNTPEERVRQVFARKLHFDYGYPKTLMAIEVPIYIGSERRSADIVVFLDEVAAQRRDQGKIRIVVETKAPDEKRGKKQLLSYIFASSAEGGVWINETDAPVYYRRGDKQELKDWPNLPRHGELWDSVGAHAKRALLQPHNLVETFRRCHNALYKQGIDSEDIAMDMVRVILAKYQDELNAGEECEFRCTPLELQSTEGRHRVADRVRSLFREARTNAPEVFDVAEEISAGDREIATVVSELQDFRFVPPEDSDELYDVVGAAYEVYVGAHLKGDRGQYFTPRLIVQLLTRIIAPDEQDVILDPAMGSGGFLIMAMRQITQSINRSTRNARAKRGAVRTMQNRLFGIDQSPKLVKVARMNMILASDGHAGLTKGDSLRPLRELPSAFRLRSDSSGQRPTVILTNPPFGATTEHRITPEKDPDIMGQFDLAHVWRPDADGKLPQLSLDCRGAIVQTHRGDVNAANLVSTGGNRGSCKDGHDSDDPERHLLEGADDRQISAGAFLAESYLKGNVALHFHANLRAVVGNLEAGDFCLTFECAEVRDGLANDMSSEPARTEFVIASQDRVLDDVDELVTVIIRQTIEQPERVIHRRSVRSIKRLLPLNDCLVFRRYESDAPTDALGQRAVGVSEVTPFKEDREFDLLINDLAVLFSEPTRKVIKGGAKLVKGLASIDAPQWRRWAFTVGLYAEIAACRAEIRDDAAIITFNQRGVFCLDGIDVIVCRRELSADPVLAVSHEVKSAYGQETAHQRGARNTDPQAQGLRRGTERHHEARQEASSQAPHEEVAPQTSPAPRSGGCSAKHTRSGSPEDA